MEDDPKLIQDLSQQVQEGYLLNGHVPCTAAEAAKCNSKRCGKNILCLNTCSANTAGFQKLIDKLSEKTTADDKSKGAEKPRDREVQPAGIRNEGNTCYLNSFLQLWFNMPAFRNAVYNWRASAHFTAPQPADPSQATVDIQQVMRALQCIFLHLDYSPYNWVEAHTLIKALLLDTQQQDAQEFGQLFMELLLSKLTAHPNGGPFIQMIQQQFRGFQEQKTTCDGCGRSNARREPYYGLQLSIEGHSSMLNALQAYMSPEQIERRCSVGGCESESATRQSTLDAVPPVLIIQLNRFVFDPKTLSRKKLSTPLAYPQHLDIGAYLAPVAVQAGACSRYALVGVLVHKSASSFHGHYYALVQDPRTQQWARYNDEEIDTIKSNKIPGFDGEEPAKMTAKNATADMKGAYLLVYRAVDQLHNIQLQQPTAALREEYMRGTQLQFESADERSQAHDLALLTRATNKHDRLLQLWSQLRVQENVLEQPLRELMVCPAKLLKAIYKHELSVASGKQDKEEESTELVPPRVNLDKQQTDSDRDREKALAQSLLMSTMTTLAEDIPVNISALDQPFVAKFCAHAKLAPAEFKRVMNLKVVRRQGLEQLAKQYSLDITHALSLEAALCSDCCSNDEWDEWRLQVDMDVAQLCNDQHTHRNGAWETMSEEERQSCFWVEPDLADRKKCVELAAKLKQSIHLKTVLDGSGIWFPSLPGVSSSVSVTTSRVNGRAQAASKSPSPSESNASSRVASTTNGVHDDDEWGQSKQKRPRQMFEGDTQSVPSDSAETVSTDNGHADKEDGQDTDEIQDKELDTEGEAGTSDGRQTPIMNGHTPAQPAPMFNTKILCECEHEEGLSPVEKRVLVSGEYWAMLKRLFGAERLTELPGLLDPCQLCAGMHEACTHSRNECRTLARAMCKALKGGTLDFICERDNSHIRPSVSANGQQLHVVCRSFLEHLRTFASLVQAGSTNTRAVPSVCNKCLLCPHAHHAGSNQHYLQYSAQEMFNSNADWVPCGYLTDEEWMLIMSVCPLTVDVDIVATIDADHTRLSHEVCETCVLQREEDRYNYKNAKIFIKQFDDEASLTMFMSANVADACASVVSSSSTLAVNGVLTAQPSRKSVRQQRTCRQDRSLLHVTVDSTALVRDIKVKLMGTSVNAMPNDQHLFFMGNKLHDMKRTLHEYRVPVNACLLLYTDGPIVKSKEELIAEKQPLEPEQGFALTGLNNRL